MLQKYILVDIIQHVFNLYISNKNEMTVLENVIGNNFKFDEKLHIVVFRKIPDGYGNELIATIILLDHKYILENIGKDGSKVLIHSGNISDTQWKYIRWCSGWGLY